MMAFLIITGLLTTSIITSYLFALFTKTYLYIISFIITFWLGCIFISYSIFLILFRITWNAITPYIENIYFNRHRYLKSIIGFCIILEMLGVWTLYRYLIPGNLFVKILGGLILSVFIVFLGSSIIRPGLKKISAAIVSAIILCTIIVYANSYTGVPVAPTAKESLASLPYLTFVPTAGSAKKSGVTIYKRKKAYRGLNLYAPRNLSKAYIIDMDGRVLHTWASGKGGWQEVTLDKNGDLIAYIKDIALLRLNWNSNVEWVRNARAHHDTTIDEKGNIYSIVRMDEIEFIRGLPVPILDDYILVMFPDGNIKRVISVFRSVKDKVPINIVAKIYTWLLNSKNLRLIYKREKTGQFLFFPDTPLDILHTNNIEIMPKDIPGIAKKGDFLISVRQLNMVGILDRNSLKLVWSWGPGQIDGQHHPTFLKNGHILVFDNGRKRGYSRVVELNPETRKIVWEYKTNPPENFCSFSRGSSQRLPNGNTLITESDKGRVFEATSKGEIVWEFYNPEMKNNGRERAAIYRMIRITDPQDYPFLKSLK